MRNVECGIPRSLTPRIRRLPDAYSVRTDIQLSKSIFARASERTHRGRLPEMDYRGLIRDFAAG